MKKFREPTTTTKQQEKERKEEKKDGKEGRNGEKRREKTVRKEEEKTKICGDLVENDSPTRQRQYEKCLFIQQTFQT